jgi:hypothetical protein
MLMRMALAHANPTRGERSTFDARLLALPGAALASQPVTAEALPGEPRLFSPVARQSGQPQDWC